MSFNKETGMYEGYIYLLINTINDKKYIGQTIRTIEERIWENFHKKKSYAISLAIQKYGKENFSWKELYKFSAQSKEELIKKLNKQEIICIQQYDSLCDGNGYNIDKGGGQASYFKNLFVNMTFILILSKGMILLWTQMRKLGYLSETFLNVVIKNQEVLVDIIGVLMETR